MRKTKIICTLGPSTDDPEVLKQLMLNGMDVARVNMSHQDHDAQRVRIGAVKKLREELNLPVALLLDTKGPEIRTGNFSTPKVELEEGQIFTLTTNDVVGDNTVSSVTFQGLPQDVKRGDRILIDDGLIEMVVESTTDTDVVCTVINGGTISSHKGINVPGVTLSMPFISPKDEADIAFAVEEGFDFIAASFTRSASDILELRTELKKNHNDKIRIIAKIENQDGVENIDEIINVADGIMVARGDLGVEIPLEEIPIIQKELIKKAYNAGLQVITATQMLDSMMRNPRPTRAEVTDVANAVYDGTDAVMLSGETAQGKYPVEALQMMVHIIENTEQHLDYDMILDKAGDHLKRGISSAIGYSSVLAAANLKAKAIITPTVSGATARVMSNLKPTQPIIGVTPSERALRRMSIYWGVQALKSMECHTTDDICSGAIDLAQAKKCVDSGDIVVLTAGIPSPSVQREKGSVSNMMRIAIID